MYQTWLKTSWHVQLPCDCVHIHHHPPAKSREVAGEILCSWFYVEYDIVQAVVIKNLVLCQRLHENLCSALHMCRKSDHIL